MTDQRDPVISSDGSAIVFPDGSLAVKVDGEFKTVKRGGTKPPAKPPVKTDTAPEGDGVNVLLSQATVQQIARELSLRGPMVLGAMQVIDGLHTPVILWNGGPMHLKGILAEIEDIMGAIVDHLTADTLSRVLGDDTDDEPAKPA